MQSELTRLGFCVWMAWATSCEFPQLLICQAAALLQGLLGDDAMELATALAKATDGPKVPRFGRHHWQSYFAKGYRSEAFGFLVKPGKVST